MKPALKINLSKTTIVFYLALAPLIAIGSLHNLIGMLTGKSSLHIYGAFSMFGFILLPLGIMKAYRNNTCLIDNDQVSIGKNTYKFSEYNFYIAERELPLKERPIFFLFKKKYYDLIITQKGTEKTVLKKELEISQKNIEKMKGFIAPAPI